MGYVIRRGRRWRLSELGEPQCAVTRSVCASGVVLSGQQLQLAALCENAAKRVDPKCSVWLLPGGDCGLQHVVVKVIAEQQTHTMAKYTHPRYNQECVCWLTMEHILSIWLVSNFQMHLCVQTRELRHGGHSLHHHTEKPRGTCLAETATGRSHWLPTVAFSTVNKVRSLPPLEREC